MLAPRPLALEPAEELLRHDLGVVLPVTQDRSVLERDHHLEEKPPLCLGVAEVRLRTPIGGLEAWPVVRAADAVDAVRS